MLRRFTPTLMLLLPLAPLLAGGFFLTVQQKDSAFTVQAQGCRDYSHASITARAEGLLNGKRESLPVELTATEKPGTYLVHKQWPDKGTWVLIFDGASAGVHTHTLVALTKGELHPHMTMQPLAPEEIEAALR